MNIKHIFSLAALALMTAACSSEDITQQPASQSAQMLPFRATINTSVITRGLTEATDGKTITAAWVVDEQIALVHSTLDNDNKPIVDVMTVEGVETNGSATIKGTATYINNTEDVYLVYVGHKDNMTTFKDFLGIALGDNSGKTIGQIVDIALEAMLAVGTQDGTLATISDNLDFRKGKSTLTLTNGLATFGNDVPTLSSQFAVWKLSLSDGSNAINASKLEITCGSDPDIDTYTITPTSGTLSTFYVLLPEKSSAFKFEATVGTTTYVYTKASVTLEKGKFYQSNMTMGIPYMVKAWNGTSVTSTLSVAESGTYTVVESSDVDVTWAAGTYVVKDDATIKGDITLTGDVKLILCDGKTLTVNGYITGDDGSSYHSLAIYGQSDDASARGMLYVKDSEDGIPMCFFSSLDIYGGDITADSNFNDPASPTSYVPIADATINVYGGKLTAVITIDKAGIAIYNNDQNITIYDGELVATGKYSGHGIDFDTGKLIVNGGKLLVSGGSDDGQALKGGNLTIGTGVIMEGSNDNSTWYVIKDNSGNYRYIRTKP